MTELESLLERALPALQPGGRWWVGYSGGLDSSLLLEAAASVARRTGCPLSALHVNHGLSPHAPEWEQHCKRFCADRQVPLIIERVCVEPAGEGLEAAARTARYAAFARHLTSSDVLLLAHHADDQSETLLLRIMRGTGIDGLSGMAGSTDLGGLRIVRPWLGVSRARLEQEAESIGLVWVEDESNQSTRFDRNHLRHAVMPALRQRWPATDAAIARLSRHASAASELLADLAAIDLADRLQADGSLRLDPLLTAARMANLLRYCCRRAGLPLPPESALDTLWRDMIPAATEACPLIIWPGAELRKYRRQLYLSTPLATPPAADHVLGRIGDVTTASAPLLIHGGLFRWDAGQGPGCLCVRQVDHLGGALSLRWRGEGESFKPAGRPRRPLRKWWQDAGIPPWRRQRTPLVYAGDTLVAVPGIGVADGFQSAEGVPGWCPVWIPEVPLLR